MTPLQPSDDRRADRDNGGARQTQDDADRSISFSTAEHLAALSHVTACRDCLRRLYEVFVYSWEGFEQERQSRSSDE